MINGEEKLILKFLEDNLDTRECFKPNNILLSLGSPENLDDLQIAKICLRLLAKGLVTKVNEIPSDPNRFGTCYRINARGLEELNPTSRNKNIYRLALIGGICSPIAIVIAIIAIIF